MNRANLKNKRLHPKGFFSSKGLKPKKRLGQNFLIDESVLTRIGEIAELNPEDEVIEIGPGLGALTRFLGKRVARVVALEKDGELAAHLKEAMADIEIVEIVEADGLKTDFRGLYNGRKLKLISNLPYNISSQVVFKATEERDVISMAVLMVQKEVGERIAAEPGGKQYGIISVLTQAYMDVSVELSVPPAAFWPAPEVDSVVIKLSPLTHPRIYGIDEALFKRVVKTGFATRRKTILNNLASIIEKPRAEQVLFNARIESRRRAETLSIEEFGRITQELAKLK